VRDSVRAFIVDLLIKCQGAPIGENREAGVNPARSRHCVENRVSLSQETCPDALQPSQHSRKGVQAATDLLGVPLMPVSFVGMGGQRDFCFHEFTQLGRFARWAS
jgi:hypothetical protein